MAQPALGLQIRQLEQDLGVDLLVRHSRGVLPTEAGALLHERALSILRQIEATRTDVQALGQSTRETLTLGLSPSLMLQIGPDLLLDAREQMPNVFLSLVEELSFILVETLERGELDITFAYEAAERVGLERRPILEEELLFVTAPAQKTAGGPITFTEALSFDLVLPGPRDLIRRLVQAEADRQGLSLRVPFEAQSISAMKAMAARGAAASIMPYGTAIDELRKGTLVSRRIERPAIKRSLYLLRSLKRPGFRHQAEIDRFLERAQERLFASLGDLATPFRG